MGEGSAVVADVVAVKLAGKASSVDAAANAKGDIFYPPGTSPAVTARPRRAPYLCLPAHSRDPRPRVDSVTTGRRARRNRIRRPNGPGLWKRIEGPLLAHRGQDDEPIPHIVFATLRTFVLI